MDLTKDLILSIDDWRDWLYSGFSIF